MSSLAALGQVPRTLGAAVMPLGLSSKLDVVSRLLAPRLAGAHLVRASPMADYYYSALPLYGARLSLPAIDCVALR